MKEESWKTSGKKLFLTWKLPFKNTQTLPLWQQLLGVSECFKRADTKEAIRESPGVSLLGKWRGKKNREENTFLITEASYILSINLAHYEEQRKFSWLGSAHTTDRCSVPVMPVGSSPSPTGQRGTHRCHQTLSAQNMSHSTNSQGYTSIIIIAQHNTKKRGISLPHKKWDYMLQYSLNLGLLGFGWIFCIQIIHVRNLYMDTNIV